MKQSKTLLWKKSCLAASLSFDNILEWLEEICWAATHTATKIVA